MSALASPGEDPARRGAEGSERWRALLTAPNLALIAAILAVYGWHVRRFWFVNDGAFISFRFARHWADGQGLVWNLGESPPVEGYSNFLWMAVATLVRRAGLDIVTWVPVLSAACGAALLVRVFSLLRVDLRLSPPIASLGAASLALYPPFAVWASSGLEAMPFALAFFVSAELLILRPGVAKAGAGAALLALALLRTEGFAWTLLLLAAASVVHRIEGRPWRRTAGVPALVSCAGFAVYFVARWAYFGRLLSNPAYAKVGANAASLWRGACYVASYELTFVAPLLVLLCAPALWRTPHRRAAALSVLVIAAFAAYSVAVGGDYMAMGRFLVPTIPFQAVLLAALVERLAAPPEGARRWAVLTRRSAAALAGAAAIVVAGLPGFDRHVVPAAVRYKLNFRGAARFRSHSEYWMWHLAREHQGSFKRLALALRQYTKPGDSVVTGGSIGDLGYYTDLDVFDQFGIVDPEVAHRPAPEHPLFPGLEKYAPVSFFLKRNPTIIQFEIVPKASLRAELESGRKACKRDHLDDRYVLDFRDLTGKEQEPGTDLVVLRRIPADVSAEAAWKGFDARLDEI